VCVCVCVCVCARVRPRARARVCVHKRASTDNLHIQRWRPNGWTDRDSNWFKHSLGQSAYIMGVGVRVACRARAVGAAQPSRASTKRENKREAREYMNGTWRRSRREREARVYGARIAQGSSQVAWSKKQKFAESQTDSSR
jgi:hypothetical protein